MKKQKKSTPLIVVMAIILAITVAVNAVAFYFDKPLTAFLGSTAVNVDNLADGLDVKYNKQSMTDAERQDAHVTLGREVAGEGIVLLKNDDALPYTQGTTFSLFSHSSVDWLKGGTGSSAGPDSGMNLKTVFEEAGFSVNETLWNFYAKGDGSGYKRGIGSIDYGDGQDFRINECPLSVMQSASVLDSAKNTVPVFILSRTGGEGVDLARGMATETSIEADKFKHYLEPDSIELEILQYLNDNFQNVVLIVNSNNAVELGWTETMPSIKTILWAPGTGTDGLYALPQLLSGAINPSGHLVDTFAYDALSAPATVNFGDMLYYPEGIMPTGDTADDLFYYYVAYEEGIYVGYRYYETRYEDAVLGIGNAGNYDYATTVQYPFGYGLSMTDYAWSDFAVTQNEKTYTVTVTVTNTGDTAGKDVVQLYAQTPYTDYDRANGVEKSAVQLVGYAKTPLLDPGASVAVSITFDEEELKAYDANGQKGYILDEGTYYLTVAPDAHAAVNAILAEKVPDKASDLIPSPSQQRAVDSMVYTFIKTALDTETYALDSLTGTTVTNQFDHATRDDITYLSRSDWEGTWPTVYGEVSTVESVYGNPTQADGKSYQYYRELSREDYQKIRSTDSLNLNPNESTSVTIGAENGIELIDLRGKDYNDPAWELLLDELTAKDYTNLIALSGYGTYKVESIKKPAASDKDGTAGFNMNGYIYFTELLIAQTWNDELMERYGELVGEDGLAAKHAGLYAPAMNLHRTPFSGRNNEYYSEDPFLSGHLARIMVQNVASKGVYTYIKHFALNEQENHRGDRMGFNGKGEWGLVTWANEQSIRELYLKPFEMSIKSGTVETSYYELDEAGEQFVQKTAQTPACNAVMSSFNRIGATWAGGNYNLITNVLRKEWGFKGTVLTDYDNGGYMDAVQMLTSGADAKLGTLNAQDYDGNTFDFRKLTDVQKLQARAAAHHILYTTANSSAMNGRIHGIAPSGTPYYIIILIVFDALAIATITLLAILIVRRKKPTKA